MKVALAADHGGYQLKDEIIQSLQAQGIDYVDFGTNSDTAVDYVPLAVSVGRAIQNQECDLGILCCGTGIGMSMAANKLHGIRAACCTDYFSAQMTRLHNDANVLCLGARVLGSGVALNLVDVFLHTPFSAQERHVRRVQQIREIEENG